MNTKEEVKEEAEVIPFPVPKPDHLGPTDWLSQLKPGTVFLYQEKNNTSFIVLEAMYGGPKGKFRMLIEGNRMFWVNPSRFCIRFECVEILEIPEEE